MIKLNMSCTTKGGGRTFTAECGDGATWVDLLQFFIVPGLQAMGYVLPPPEVLVDCVQAEEAEDV